MRAGTIFLITFIILAFFLGKGFANESDEGEYDYETVYYYNIQYTTMLKITTSNMQRIRLAVGKHLQ